MIIPYHTLIQTVLFGACLALLWLGSSGVRYVARTGGAALLRVANRPAWAYAALALYTLLLLGTLAYVAWPHPVAHDEYCYQLAGDTFARGRLVNPVHPLWRSFETFHVVSQPVYAAKYPPGQGMVLAAGQWLGHQVVGLWISFVGAVLAVFWLLRLVLPPVSALVGGLMVATQPLIVLNWGMAFWGGALPMLGGALVSGAAIELLRGQRTWGVPVRLALGLPFLWYSRPYEGAVFSLLPLAVLGWAGVRGVQAEGRRLMIRWLPGLLLIVAVGAGLLSYNQRITGNPLKFPYSYYYERYEWARPFLFQPEGQPVADRMRPEMTRFHVTERTIFRDRHTVAGLLRAVWSKAYLYGIFYTGLLFLIPLWVFLRHRKAPADRYLLLATAMAVAANLVCTYEMPQYIATATGPLAVIIGRGLYWMQQRTQTVALQTTQRAYLMRLAILALLISSLLTLIIEAVSTTHRQAWQDVQWRRRHEMTLNQKGGQHVILVHYAPTHPTNREWVYNSADIDGQSVIWAADRDEAQNRALLSYYSNRTIWRLHPDERVDQLEKVIGGH